MNTKDGLLWAMKSTTVCMKSVVVFCTPVFFFLFYTLLRIRAKLEVKSIFVRSSWLSWCQSSKIRKNLWAVGHTLPCPCSVLNNPELLAVIFSPVLAFFKHWFYASGDLSTLKICCPEYAVWLYPHSAVESDVVCLVLVVESKPLALTVDWKAHPAPGWLSRILKTNFFTFYSR